MVVCEMYQMYDAIIYVYNNAMLDYISPAEKLLAEVKTGLASGQPLTQEQVGFVLTFFIWGGRWIHLTPPPTRIFRIGLGDPL